MIPEAEWRWCGYPGHFIGADDCRFRMITEVGDVRVSTVGDYFPPPKDERREIGLDRLYETMVFPLGEAVAECGCREISDWSEIDFDGYNDAGAAREGHVAMCRKYAAGEVPS